MNKEKRQFVHELAVYFGCTTEAYDAEPKRNVVATAGTPNGVNINTRESRRGYRHLSVFT